MEETCTEAGLYAFGGKGGKGQKGKGKGGVEGIGNYCGMYGHRLNQCWKKDQEMKGKG